MRNTIQRVSHAANDVLSLRIYLLDDLSRVDQHNRAEGDVCLFASSLFALRSSLVVLRFPLLCLCASRIDIEM